MKFMILALCILGMMGVMQARPFSWYYPETYRYYYPKRHHHHNGNCYWLYTNGSYVHYCD